MPCPMAHKKTNAVSVESELVSSAIVKPSVRIAELRRGLLIKVESVMKIVCELPSSLK
jgi:hypothetical protein